MKKLVAIASALVALGGCADLGLVPPPADYPQFTSAGADLRSATGASVGTATVTQVGDRLRLAVDASSLPPGARGIHIHQMGVCAGPDFTSAGPHWNPAGRQHGKDNPAGMHLGDLPNLLIGADGRGSMEYTIPAQASLVALLDGDGASVVIHATSDDYRTDPSGNSGARIACGVLQPR
ncbi:MAG TPA: superoxide dismutase family protein [Allosphingosinicella sp.]|uniref:superoxide dismutase family protein n=1 Tax=Allosphingosinicella sp. TaxID=2823234 RepID=UPI002ED8A2EA